MSPSRSLMRTLAPCSLSSSAVARPMPRAEPVTIATFPSRTPMFMTPDSWIGAPILYGRAPRVRSGDLERLEQVEPDLAAGGERRDRVAQALDRHLADDGDGRGVQEVGDLGAGEGGADDHAAALVDDQPRRAGRAPPVEGAARVPGRLGVDDLAVEPRLLGALAGVPDGGDLRVREDHAGAARPVGEVWRRARASEQVIAGQAR